MANKTVAMTKRRSRAGQLDWNAIVLKGKEVLEEYDTGVTLRQLYYRLVALDFIPNKRQSYKMLSAKTAQARREGWFPSFIDRTRGIERDMQFNSPDEALEWLDNVYRRDRTEGQDWSIYIAVEKHGLTTQLTHWFGDLGIPIMALGGYSSQTFVDVVSSDANRQDRQSVLLYAGDFDPSGMDIDRDFTERTEIFDEVVRVALTPEIVAEYELPPKPGKSTDSRAAKFMLEHGELVQVEVDALAPKDLRKLYQAAIDQYWDKEAYESVVAREEKENLVLGDFLTEHRRNDVTNIKLRFDKVDDLTELEYLSVVLSGRIEDLRRDVK